MASASVAERGGGVIAVDVGGTKTAIGLVDVETGNVDRRFQIPTGADRPGNLVLDDVVSSVLGMGVGGGLVGLAICELVDLTGRVASAHTIDWTDLDPEAALAPVGRLVLSSDVRAGALAESRLGAGRGLQSFIFVAVGTGISAAFVLEGVPWTGANGSALVLASGAIGGECPTCGGDSSVVPEEVASGGGMTRKIAAARPDLGIERTEQAVAAAEAGEPEAVEILSEGGRTLGEVVAWAVNLLDPHAVVMGGGLGLAGGLYRERFLDSLRDHVWAKSSRQVPVVEAVLGTDAALVGAALAAADGRPA